MTAAARDPDGTADVLVIGSGIAGLSAAVSAAEALDGRGRVTVVDRAGEAEAGGNTRWTSAYFRLDDVYEPAANFADDLMAFSAGKTPRWYVDTLLDRLPETMEWIQSHGARFRPLQTYFVTSARPRLQPRGGGEGLLQVLRAAARDLGVTFRYLTTAQELVTDPAGRVTGVRVSGPEGAAVLPARTVVIASGGFEGDPDSLTEHLGGNAATLLPIAPSVHGNRGEGIRMALSAGAARAGQWDSFHAEPVDPRSKDAEAIVMVYPYGILVDRTGQRFIDEGRGTVDETYESTARAIWTRPGGTAWFITDQHINQVEGYQRGVLSPVGPVAADSIVDLAAALGLPADALADTVTAYNAATTGGAFDWRRPDGLGTQGIDPPKSNWALPLDMPPFLAYPVACAIVFTFGGLATDANAQVVRDDQSPIPGLYAAGECTGVYYHKYPGGTSVLRGMVFGRIAGRSAAGAALAVVGHA
ncbi:MAG: FAD-dependent oxidoreductase [Micromonosporaceae bacterium]|jgi:tricarballylate dehydrogenase|nr:FAD-dependent oxidoreductase [Micromonosporaceae bacterium]